MTGLGLQCSSMPLPGCGPLTTHYSSLNRTLFICEMGTIIFTSGASVMMTLYQDISKAFCT